MSVDGILEQNDDDDNDNMDIGLLGTDCEIGSEKMYTEVIDVDYDIGTGDNRRLVEEVEVDDEVKYQCSCSTK